MNEWNCRCSTPRRWCLRGTPTTRSASPAGSASAPWTHSSPATPQTVSKRLRESMSVSCVFIISIPRIWRFPVLVKSCWTIEKNTTLHSQPNSSLRYFFPDSGDIACRNCYGKKYSCKAPYNELSGADMLKLLDTSIIQAGEDDVKDKCPRWEKFENPKRV